MTAIQAKQYTKAAIEQLAPEELLLVDGYNPDTAFKAKTADGPQGFGVSEAIVLMTPFIYAFFMKYTEAMASEAGKAAFSTVIDWLKQKSPEHERKAHDDIRKALAVSGVPEDNLDNATQAVLASLGKFS